MASRLRLYRSITSAALALLATAVMTLSLPSPARADRCDDSAKVLADNIDKLKVNFRAANTVYMTHPLARELSVACRGDNYSIELYAKGDRRPAPEFVSLVGAMAAIVFTVTKDDTTTGATRCLKRMGLLRGDKVALRYRRLNMECTRNKTDVSIAVTRGKDE
jgi:hypothetical protein